MDKLLATMLAVYAISHMIVFEYGPYDILSKFRYMLGVRIGEDGFRSSKTMLGKLLNCQICTSVWLAFPIAWICSVSSVFSYAMAAVGLVCIMEDLT